MRVKRKIVTICGSLKFADKIQQIAEKLELEKEYVVLNIIPHTMDRTLTESESKLLGELHREKIDISGIFGDTSFLPIYRISQLIILYIITQLLL